MTKLIAANFESTLCDPLVLAAGTDITHWFDPNTREPKTFIHPETNLETTYTPSGRYLHIPAMAAASNAATEVSDFNVAWWNNTDEYCIGNLTKCVR